MQLFLADCQFPDIENQVKAYQLFVEAWENGEIAKSDKNILLNKVGGYNFKEFTNIFFI